MTVKTLSGLEDDSARRGHSPITTRRGLYTSRSNPYSNPERVLLVMVKTLLRPGNDLSGTANAEERIIHPRLGTNVTTEKRFAMHQNQQSWRNPQANRIVVPNQEGATAIVIPLLGEEPSLGASTIQTRKASNPEERSWAGILLVVGVLAMFGMWSLFGGSAPITPSPAITTQPQAPSEEASWAEVTIEVEPSLAKLQAAAISLGATLTETGQLTTRVRAGETLAITASLDGYQTVQKSLSVVGGTQVLRLVLEPRPAEAAPRSLVGPQRAPAQPKRVAKLSPAAPNECLD